MALQTLQVSDELQEHSSESVMLTMEPETDIRQTSLGSLGALQNRNQPQKAGGTLCETTNMSDSDDSEDNQLHDAARTNSHPGNVQCQYLSYSYS